MAFRRQSSRDLDPPLARVGRQKGTDGITNNAAGPGSRLWDLESQLIRRQERNGGFDEPALIGRLEKQGGGPTRRNPVAGENSGLALCRVGGGYQGFQP